MWEFLQSKAGMILLLCLIAAAFAVVLVHSMFTRRAVKRMLDYKYTEMSVLSMFAEVDRNREKYSALSAGNAAARRGTCYCYRVGGGPDVNSLPIPVFRC